MESQLLRTVSTGIPAAFAMNLVVGRLASV
jgi:hypothetical protein